MELRSIVALAQHHGLPTRLLDWSYDPRIAALFAARDALKDRTKNLAVWALNRDAVRMRSMVERMGDEARANAEDKVPRLRLSLVTAPSASNLHLRAQHGLFTLLEPPPGINLGPRTAELRAPLDQALVADSEDELPERTLRKFTLPTTECPTLIRRLAMEAVTAATIWPTYDGVVTRLRETAGLL